MTTNILNDIRLSQFSLESLPNIAKLRTAQIKLKPQVCIERARYVTRYLRDLADKTEPMEIRYAKAVHYFLSNKKPQFFDDNLLAGTRYHQYTGKKSFAAFRRRSKRTEF